MQIGTLSIDLSANTSRLQSDMDKAKSISGTAMGQISKDVTVASSAMDGLGNTAAQTAEIMRKVPPQFVDIVSGMIKTNEAIRNASSLVSASIEQIAISAGESDYRTLSEKISGAIAFGVGAGFAAANTAWDGFVEYSKTKALIAGVAVSAVFAAVGLGAVYMAYKVISGSMDFIIGLITGDSYKSASIDALITANNEVKEIQKSLNLTASQAAATNEAIKAIGIDKSDYSTVFKASSDAIRENTDELDKLGLSYKNTDDLIQSANKYLNEYSEGWDRNKAASELGLGTATQIAAAAKITEGALQEASARLAEYNLGIGTESQDAARRYTDTMREFNHNMELTAQGFKRAWADQILPILTDLADFFKDGFPTAVQVFRGAMMGFTTVIYGLKTSFFIVAESIVGSLSAIGTAIVGAAEASALAMKGDFLGAKDALLGGWEDAKKRLNSIGENIVEQARHNSAAMRMAWGTDDRSSSSEQSQSGKTFIDPAIAKKIEEQAAAYKKIADAIVEKTNVQKLEIDLNDKTTEGQKLSVKFASELAAGTSTLTDAQKADYAQKIENLIAQEKINKKMEEARKIIQAAESDYSKLTKSINEKIAAANAELVAGAALNEAEKMRVKMLSDLRDGVIKMTAAEIQASNTKLNVLDTELKSIEAKKEVQKLFDSIATKSKQALDAANQEADANQRLADTFGMTRQQIALMELARLEDQLAQRSTIGMAYAEIAALEALIDAKKRSIAPAGEVDTMTAAEDAKKQLDKLFDPTKGREFGNAIKGSMGEAISAISKLDDAMRTYSKNQAANEKEIALAHQAATLKDKTEDPIILAAELKKVNDKSAQSQLANYAQIAGAAKGFFKENTAGYKVMESAEKAFQAVSLALNLKSIAEKVLGEGIKSAAVITGQGVETGAVAGGEAARNVIKTPGVFMAFMSALGPWGAAAAAVAVGAVLGGAAGAFDTGGGGMSSEEMQKQQGTGGVFGDAQAKSDSVLKSIDMLQKTSSQLLPVNQGMLAALRSIESAMVGVTNLFVRTPGITDGSNFGIKTGQQGLGGDHANQAITSITNSIFGSNSAIGQITAKLGNIWGKTSTNIVDAGVQFGGKVNSLASGQGFDQYASVNTTKKSFFGLVTNTSNAVQTGGLSSELSTQLGLIFSGMKSALTEANKALGSPIADIQKTFADLTLSTQKISLKGLTGQALTDALNSVISKSLDEMATAAFPQFDSFRAVGEGYAQTVLRVANTFATVNQAMGELNLNLFAADKAGIGATLSLAELAGGLDQLQSQTADYYQNFFTESERTAKTMASLTAEFAHAGLGALPKTRDDFRVLMESFTDPAQIAAMLRLEGAFASVVPAATAAASAVDQLAKAQQEAAALAGKRSNLEIQIMELSGNAAGALAAKRKIELAATDESLRGLQMTIYGLQDKAVVDAAAKQAAQAAAQAQQQAAQAADQAAKQVVVAWQSVTDAIVAEVRRIRGLVDGNSTQSFAGLQAQFATSTAQARAGDQSAAKALPGISQALLLMAESQATSAQNLAQIRAMTASSLQDTATGMGRYGVTVPGFASGGDFGGGLRLVGEHGPELESTGPSRIFNTSQTKSMLGGGGDKAELKALRAEVANLNFALIAIAENTGKSAKVLFKNDTGVGILTTLTVPA